MTAKIRHIAFSTEDPEAIADFFIKGFGMTLAQRRSSGAIDLSDGTINITVLPPMDGMTRGINHLGFTAGDDDVAREAILAAGGKELHPIRSDSANYELKFEGPEGIVVDIGHWAGTAPLDEKEPAAGASSR